VLGILEYIDEIQLAAWLKDKLDITIKVASITIKRIASKKSFSLESSDQVQYSALIHFDSTQDSQKF